MNTDTKKDLSQVFQQRPALPGRVLTPGVDQDEVDALQERFDHFARTRLGYLRGMMRKGAIPFQGVPADVKAERRARGKRQRRARRVARGG